MSREVVLHPLAALDVVRAWEWYEHQMPGLGDRFVVAVQSSNERAARWPDAGAPVGTPDGGEVVERRVAPAGFPYVVRYRVTDRQVIVIAVHHRRRRPEFGLDRQL